MSETTTGDSQHPLSIDKDCGIPIWLQLRNRLIYLITSGYYQVGDKIPTVRELAVGIGVNYNTVSKVYRDIERDGYIVSLRGKGTSVHDGFQVEDDPDDAAKDALIDDFILQCLELVIVKEDIPKLVERRLH